MPLRRTMGTLLEQSKTLCDLLQDDHISDARWKLIISNVYGEMWSEVSMTGRRYFEDSTTITADGSDSYDEPEGHYSTVRITRIDGDREYPLDELMPQEEARFRGCIGDARYWTLVDDQLWLYPKPSSGTYEWRFVQQPTNLASYADGDFVDCVCPAGLAFLLNGVAVVALGLREKNVQLWIAERERQRELLQVWAADRNKYGVQHRVEDDEADLRRPGDW